MVAPVGYYMLFVLTPEGVSVEGQVGPSRPLIDLSDPIRVLRVTRN
jgi:hypothetical protein